jgi:molecular chaperone GrpE (heat shock protein)
MIFCACEGEPQMDINTEFFKKLNQQINQKDQFIELLQMQIEKLREQKGITEESEILDQEAGISSSGDSEYETLIKEKDETISRLNDEIENISLKLKEEAETVKDLKSQMDVQKNNPLFNHPGLTDRDMKKLLNSSENIEEYEDTIKKLTDRLAEIEPKLIESIKFSDENFMLKERLKELELRLKELDETKSAFNEKHSDNILSESSELEYKNKIEDLTLQIADKENIINELTLEIEKNSSELEKIEEEYEVHKSSTDEIICSLHEKIESLEESLKKFSSADMEAEKLIKKVNDLQEKLDKANYELSIGQVNELTNEENKELSQEIEKYRILADTLKESLENAEARITQLVDKNMDLMKKIEDNESNLELIRGTAQSEAYEKVSAEKNELLSQLNQKDTRIKELQEINKTLETANLEKANKNIGSDKSQIIVQPEQEEQLFLEYIHLCDRIKADEFNNSKDIGKEIDTILLKRGVEKIASEGAEFNSRFHEVKEYVRSSDYKENTIIQEFSPGYIIDGRVIRKSSVAIIKNRLVCPACSTTGREGSNFCDKCGSPLSFPQIKGVEIACEHVREIGKVAEIYVKIGKDYEKKGSFAQAIKQFEEALRIKENDPEIMLYIAGAYELMGEYSKALEVYEKIRFIKPGDSKIESVIDNIKIKIRLTEQIKSIRY